MSIGRLIGYVSLLFVAACSSSSSGSFSDGGFAESGSSSQKPTGAACGSTPGAPTGCEGGGCLRFAENPQGVPGMCTKKCTVSADCGNGNVCLDFGEDKGKLCLRGCADNAGCLDGLVCQVMTDSGTKACWID